MADPTEVEDEPGYQTASSVTVTAISTAYAPEYYECLSCRGSAGWVDNGYGQWEECPACTPRVADAAYPVDNTYY